MHEEQSKLLKKRVWMPILLTKETWRSHLCVWSHACLWPWCWVLSAGCCHCTVGCHQSVLPMYPSFTISTSSTSVVVIPMDLELISSNISYCVIHSGTPVAGGEINLSWSIQSDQCHYYLHHLVLMPALIDFLFSPTASHMETRISVNMNSHFGSALFYNKEQAIVDPLNSSLVAITNKSWHTVTFLNHFLVLRQ